LSVENGRRPPGDPLHPPPPHSWPTVRAAAQRLVSPVERFLSVEAASGILLLVAAAVAMVWANSPWRPAYEALWHTPIGFRVGGLSFERDLHFWVNDGLMVVFFFVVGLEIRRELHHGELSEPRRAALPAFAALGGMVVPACIFLGLNAGRPSASGWGVPVATDIAFAVGVLVLLGKRARPALRVMLLALAVIDDLGAIVVIAVFYSSQIDAGGLAIAGGGVLALLAMQKLGVRSPWAYVVPGMVIWAGAHVGGIHPTLAGVVLGLLTPVRVWLGAEVFMARATATLEAIRPHQQVTDERRILPELAALEGVSREAVSPVERLQFALHGWVAYLIMPVFALANAGVPLGEATLDGDGRRVLIGVVLGLLIGKPIGILFFSRVAVGAGIAALPAGVGWMEILVMGTVAGIGFTMSLFIAGLAFPPGPLLEVAKVAILCASALAAIVGLTVGRAALSAVAPEEAAGSEVEAERSTST
jgi:Na+:H+ antiporter, NhaA family